MFVLFPVRLFHQYCRFLLTSTFNPTWHPEHASSFSVIEDVLHSLHFRRIGFWSRAQLIGPNLSEIGPFGFLNWNILNPWKHIDHIDIGRIWSQRSHMVYSEFQRMTSHPGSSVEGSFGRRFEDTQSPKPIQGRSLWGCINLNYTNTSKLIYHTKSYFHFILFHIKPN